jgi:uncharacterized protein YecE (DUF72 family)
MSVMVERHVRIGTSGWSYPKGEGTWNGIFYPARPKNELALYSSVFNTVEVNSTFYRLLDPHTARAWVTATPQDFEFAIKVWQKFTHRGMFRKATGGEPVVTQRDYDDFKRGINPIAEEGKLGCLLVQFSEWFARTPENEEALSDILSRFQDYPIAVELRHVSWGEHAGATRALLAPYGAGWAFIDMPVFRETIRQDVEPQQLVYVRFHGRNREKWRAHDTADERYDYLYSDDELRPIAERIRVVAGTGTAKVLIYFNNHARAQAPANALMMARQIGLPPQGVVREEFIRAFPRIREAVRGVQPADQRAFDLKSP